MVLYFIQEGITEARAKHDDICMNTFTEKACGGGEIEFAHAVSELVESISVEFLYKLSKQETCGVAHYDVLNPLGRWIADHCITHNQLPCEQCLKDKHDQLWVEFTTMWSR